MNRIEWIELRSDYGGRDSYHVVASEVCGVWRIVEAERWDSKSYLISQTQKRRYEAIADYARDGFLAGLISVGTKLRVFKNTTAPSLFCIHSCQSTSVPDNEQYLREIDIEVCFRSFGGVAEGNANLFDRRAIAA